MPSTQCGFSHDPTGQGRDLLVLTGPTLAVDIGFDPTFVAGGGANPNLAMKDVQALVDTGATTSCIDSGLAVSLNLPIVDQQVMSGISGHTPVNMHLAQIFVPSLGFTIYGQFAGVDLAAGGQSHGALIGRTFLQYFRMAYDGTSGEVMIEGPITPSPPAPTLPASPPVP